MSAPFNSLVVNSSTTQAKRLSVSPMAFRAIVIVGVNAYDSAGKGTANTGAVYIGTDARQLPLSVQAGKDITITAPPGVAYDLSDFWMVPATANDGVAVFVTA